MGNQLYKKVVDQDIDEHNNLIDEVASVLCATQGTIGSLLIVRLRKWRA